MDLAPGTYADALLRTAAYAKADGDSFLRAAADAGAEPDTGLCAVANPVQLPQQPSEEQRSPDGHLANPDQPGVFGISTPLNFTAGGSMHTFGLSVRVHGYQLHSTMLLQCKTQCTF